MQWYTILQSPTPTTYVIEPLEHKGLELNVASPQDDDCKYSSSVKPEFQHLEPLDSQGVRTKSHLFLASLREIKQIGYSK